MSRSLRIQLAILLVAAVLATTHAAICPKTGEPAPEVITLMASKTRPENESWVVLPDCTVEVQPLRANDLALSIARFPPIDRVESVPSGAQVIETWFHAFAVSADFSKAWNATYVHLISRYEVDRIDHIVWPPSMRTLELFCGNRNSRCPIKSIDNVTFPETLESIYMSPTSLTSLENIKMPKSLRRLWLGDAFISRVHNVSLEGVEELELGNNPIKSFENVTLSPRLRSFGCFQCKIPTLRGVKWPSTLETLTLSYPTILEIRESDVPTIQKLKEFAMYDYEPLTECDDPTANIAQVRSNPNISACVITDARFEARYEPKFVSIPTPNNTVATLTPSSGSGSGGGNEIFAGDEGTVGSETSSQTTKQTRLPTTEGVVDEDEDPTDTSTSFGRPKERSNKPAATTTSSPIQSNNRTNEPSKPSTNGSSSYDDAVEAHSSTRRHDLVIVASVLSGVAALAIAVVIYRIVFAATHRDDDKYTSMESPKTGDTNPASVEPDWKRLEMLANELRDDALLSTFAVDERDVTFSKSSDLQRLGTTIRGSYKKTPVMIKRMRPDSWRDEVSLELFLRDIRMATSLEHPRVVKFIGLASTSIRDLTAIVEFMPGGDLESLMAHQSSESTGREWSEPWTPSHLKSKCQIAADVAEAVVYLHSFTTPIVHHNLRTKTVLLDRVGNAKLDGMSVGRERGNDTITTSEAGVVAWIAPEVMRGERSSEKADIYSFGVLLVELDRCSHPFADEAEWTAPETSAVQVNTSFILRVGAGQLHPTPTSSCPSAVSALIRRCLSFDPHERPSAMEVFYELRKAYSALQSSSPSDGC